MRHFFTKIVGVSHRNDDGTSRQDAIRGCQPGERLLLQHEDSNRVDANAVMVRRQDGKQLGYVSRRLAAEIVSRSADGYRYAALITAVTGGDGYKRNRGVNLLMLVADPSETDGDAQAYLNGISGEASVPDLRAAYPRWLVAIGLAAAAAVVLAVLNAIVG